MSAVAHAVKYESLELQELVLPDFVITPQQEPVPDLRQAWSDRECRSLLEKVIARGMLADSPGLADRFLGRIEQLCLSNCTPDQIYESLARFWKSAQFASEFKRLNRQDEDLRIQRRINQIVAILPADFLIQSFCDIGCGDGRITSGLAEKWQLKYGQVFGADIFDRLHSDTQFQALPMRDQSSIPTKDSSLSVLTALMTLHHHPAPQDMIAEMSRVLKSGGIAIIRESDTNTPAEHLFQAVLDHLYYRVYNLLPGIPEPDSHRSASEWISMFETQGFVLLKLERPEPDSPINPVHFVFQKSRAD